MDRVAERTGAIVNFHDHAGVCLTHPSLRLRPEQFVHHGAYCAFAKSQGHFSHCSANKERSLRRAREGKPFSGCCPFGVWDLAHPVRFEERLLGVFYVGSLKRRDQELAPVNDKPFTGRPLPAYSAGRRQLCARYARYLADHLTLFVWKEKRDGRLLAQRRTAAFYVEATERFVQTHYTEDISLQDLAERLNVHANYLGALLREQTGRSFREHLTAYRLEQACVRLRCLDQPITEIAYTVGFNDGNYFSTVFRHTFGISPRAWRRQHQKAP